ncbi:hypothetical protein GCM10023067_54920 [Aminobacter aganoensis]|nr:hypothetical protein [Aminobacter aganoensis]
MTRNTDEDAQLDIFRRIAAEATYTTYTLAEEYGLSDGQARALIHLHGPSREKLRLSRSRS